MRRLSLMHCALALLTLASACGGSSGDPAPTASPRSSTSSPIASTPTQGSDASTPLPRATLLPAIDVRYPGGTIRAELADDASERGRGLCCRDSLAADSGMLFDLGEERVPSFWMKDTRIPLDMVWIDASKRIVGVAANVQPEPGVADGDLQRYSPDQPIPYVLEVNACAAAHLGLTPGVQLDFELP